MYIRRLRNIGGCICLVSDLRDLHSYHTYTDLHVLYLYILCGCAYTYVIAYEYSVLCQERARDGGMEGGNGGDGGFSCVEFQGLGAYAGSSRSLPSLQGLGFMPLVSHQLKLQPGDIL